MLYRVVILLLLSQLCFAQNNDRSTASTTEVDSTATTTIRATSRSNTAAPERAPRAATVPSTSIPSTPVPSSSVPPTASTLPTGEDTSRNRVPIEATTREPPKTATLAPVTPPRPNPSSSVPGTAPSTLPASRAVANVREPVVPSAPRPSTSVQPATQNLERTENEALTPRDEPATQTQTEPLSRPHSESVVPSGRVPSAPASTPPILGNQPSDPLRSPTEQQPIKQQPIKLPRGGSLLSQGLPSAPVLPTKNEQLPPLRQLLITAPDKQTAEVQRRRLTQLGLRILSRKNLNALGIVLSTYRVPASIDLHALINMLRQEFPDVDIEPNQRYRLLGSNKHSYGQKMVGLNTPSQCTQPLQLAMLDSAVNSDWVKSSNGRVKSYDVTGVAEPPDKHGTAVASLLVSGQPRFPGLLPFAQLQAINVFAQDKNNSPETRTDWLIKGLNVLAGLSPKPVAVNMSFGGEHSALLENTLQKLSQTMVFVAAAGNDGSSTLVYPAAYKMVYAVAAINARGKKTRQSNHGAHIALMAPGEDIWTQKALGKGSYMSGTSFAAPFATAALAVVRNAKKSDSAYIEGLGDKKVVSFNALCPNDT